MSDNPKQKSEPVACYVNPFERAFPVHNPTTGVERAGDANKLDVAALRHMNSEEDLSLFKCKKKYTLVIKQYCTPTVTGPQNDPTQPGGFLEHFGMAKKKEQVDYAAENAHHVAELLRQQRLEAYVLHMKFASVVTIGGYDSLDDPNLRTMKNLIETKLVPTMHNLELFPQAMAWEIPH